MVNTTNVVPAFIEFSFKWVRQTNRSKDEERFPGVCVCAHAHMCEYVCMCARTQVQNKMIPSTCNGMGVGSNAWIGLGE